jgi:LacI family transcriptional regulator/LacI family repressor for deo operon, udp, cdd, tsx, nupC, and nupG
VDGLIINPLQDDEMDLSHLFEIRRRNIPLVMLESIRGLQASMVDVDNVAASRAAVEHLISGGHTRIIHFSGPPYSMHSDERIEGVRRAFSAQHLAFKDDDVVHVGARLEDGYAVGLEYFRDLSESERPTAVTCYNDLVAIGLIRALTELGLKVPDDISIIGYDDIDMATYGPIPLTTVRVPKKEMGRRSAQILIQHVEAHDAGTIEKVFLEPKMIVRESTRVIEAVHAGKRKR